MAAWGFAADELQPSARQTFVWTPKGKEVDHLANLVARKLCYRMDASHGEQKGVGVHGENIGPRDDSNPDQVKYGQTVETTIQPKGKAGRPTKQAQAKETRKQKTQEKRAATRATRKKDLPTASKAKSESKRIFVGKKIEPILPPVQTGPTYPTTEELSRRIELDRIKEALDASAAKLQEQIDSLPPRERVAYDDLQRKYEQFYSRADVDIQLAVKVAKLPPAAFIDLMTDENGTKAVIAKVMALIGKKGKK